jgi:DNA gyrase subunit A
MFFTEQGQAFWLKVYDIPEFAKNQKGRAIQNMLNTSESNKVTAFLKVESFADAEFNDSHYLVFVTEKGIVKKTKLAAYSRPRANGINAINLQEDDRVVKVVMTDGKQHIVLANRNGRAITFPETNVRTMGRVATGVRGMRLDEDGEDKIVGMVALPYPGAPIGEESANENENENENDQEVSLENLFDMPEEEASENAETEEVVTSNEENPLNDSVLVVSENGYGKRSFITGYRITRRGGKGVKTLNISDKTGPVIALMKVNDNDDLMIINKSGIAIRMHCQYDAETSQGLRIMGRAAQGVKLIDLTKKNDSIASVCRVISEQEEENVEAEEDTLPSDENLNLGSEASSNEENQ